jgi:hypothetical protein
MSCNRRLAGVIITGEDVALLALEGQRVVHVSSPVPATASFFTSYFDHSRNAYVAVFEDDSFGPIASGGLIPILCNPVASVTEFAEGDLIWQRLSALVET